MIVTFDFATTSKQICTAPPRLVKVSEIPSPAAGAGGFGAAFGPMKLSSSVIGSTTMHIDAAPAPDTFGTSLSMKLSTVPGSTSLACTWTSKRSPLASATTPAENASEIGQVAPLATVNDSGQSAVALP